MNTEAYNLYSIILSTAALVVTAGGLFAVYVQIQKLREAAWSTMHSKLCDQSFEVLKFLSETPSTYAYFYEKKLLLSADPHYIMVLYQAEAVANFLEHLMLQQTQLPSEQWAVWRRFIYGTFQASVVVCQFIVEHHDWYSPALVAIASECRQTLPPAQE